MVITDPIADMLTRIRNANTAKHSTVNIPLSKQKLAIAEILKSEGFISGYEQTIDGAIKMITVTLKYSENGTKVLQGLKRISKPGLRMYANAESIPQVVNGLGIAIVSTNKGIMTDKNARKNNIGGEVLAYIW